MQIQNCFRLAVAGLVFSLAAWATDVPTFETYLGYDFTRFEPGHSQFPNINMNGGTAQFVYNAWKSLGVVFDAGAVTKGVLNQQDVDTTLVHYVIGPRYALHNHGKFSPFVHIMFGGYYGTASQRIQVLPAVNPPVPLPTQVLTARLTASHSDFAMLVGGGLDYKINKHVAFRPFEADYFLTRNPDILCLENNSGCVVGSTSNPGVNQNNWRLTAGINFMFGKR